MGLEVSFFAFFRSLLTFFLNPQEREEKGSNSSVCCFSDQTKEWSPDPVEHVLQAHTDWVRDVAWAPSVGVGKAYLASAGQVSHFSHLFIL